MFRRLCPAARVTAADEGPCPCKGTLQQGPFFCAYSSRKGGV